MLVTTADLEYIFVSIYVYCFYQNCLLYNAVGLIVVAKLSSMGVTPPINTLFSHYHCMIIS